MKTFFTLLLLSLLGLSAPVYSKSNKKGVVASVELSPAGSFEISFPSISGSAMKTKTGYIAKKIKVKVKKLTTGVDLRDDHTKKKLDYKKHKTIVLTDGVARKGKGKAKLKVKGITKPIVFTYKIEGKMMVASFSVRASDYKLSGIKYLGVGVKDVIQIVARIPIK